MRPLGKGRSNAVPKITTMTALRQGLATETVEIDQCKFSTGMIKANEACSYGS